jgi:hypothetical protein
MTQQVNSDILDKCVQEIRLNNPTLRDSTLKNYKNMLFRILKGSLSAGLNIDSKKNIPFAFKYNSHQVINVINKQLWLEEPKPITERTKKNYFAVMLSLLRGTAQDEPESDYLKNYTYHFETLNSNIKAMEMNQAPKPKEQQLKDLSIKELLKGLNYHKSKSDIDSTLLALVGAINCYLCLRNEPANMMLSNDYLSQDDPQYERTNFIWNKGRNKKYMYIRYNKVRTEKDEQREIPITGDLNTLLNKYIKQYNDMDGDKDLRPLLWKSKGEEGCMSDANYVGLVKRVWKHMDLDLTSTLIRKVYAMDIRTQYNGKLSEEMKACVKLDHSKAIHDSNYIVFFD